MSYEGADYYITKSGVFGFVDSNFPLPDDAEWVCSVDETNGFLEDVVSTHNPETKSVGVADDWRTDKYGNKYVIEVYRYAPVNGPGLNEWRKVE